MSELHLTAKERVHFHIKDMTVLDGIAAERALEGKAGLFEYAAGGCIVGVRLCIYAQDISAFKDVHADLTHCLRCFV